MLYYIDKVKMSCTKMAQEKLSKWQEPKQTWYLTSLIQIHIETSRFLVDYLVEVTASHQLLVRYFGSWFYLSFDCSNFTVFLAS